MSNMIFLLEDDDALAMGIEYALNQEGFDVKRASCLKQMRILLTEYETTENTLALFDVMLPDGTGFDMLDWMHSSSINIPVIFLTALSDEINIVQGLDLGADDYITKPFRVKELLSRVKALMRRTYKTNLDNNNSLTYKDLIIDVSQAKIFKISENTKKQLDLTPTEYRILLYFLENKGTILTRNQILNRLFDEKGKYIDDNALSVYMKRLREKLNDENETVYIKTIRGIGYLME